MIRLTVPSIGQQELAACQRVLSSGMLVQGSQVREFEKNFGEYVSATHAIAVSSGTAALHLSLMALGIGPVDSVAVTAYSWPATANVIEVCGARPVFIDIETQTFAMDPEALRRALDRSSTKIKAILLVHPFGQIANMTELQKISAKYEIPIVEDAACAIGSRRDGHHSGHWGLITCYSFHPRKVITTGEGGMITTRDEQLAKKIRTLRNHGLDTDSSSPEFITAGLNYRLTEFQAAIGIEQLAKLDRILEARRHRAGLYDRLLKNTPAQPPIQIADNSPNYQSYVTLVDVSMAQKAELIQRLKENGVETTIGTWHMPLIRYFREKYGYGEGDFPITDQVFRKSLSLPMHENLTSSEQEKVVHDLCTCLREVCR